MVLVVMEARASCLLGKCSTTEMHAQLVLATLNMECPVLLWPLCSLGLILPEHPISEGQLGLQHS